MKLVRLTLPHPPTGAVEQALLERACRYAIEWLHADQLVWAGMAAPTAPAERLPSAPAAAAAAAFPEPGPALFAPDYAFDWCELAADGTVRKREQIPFRLPGVPGLCDFHVHTPLAYCQENLELGAIFELARIAGAEFALSEHSCQLYFSREDCRKSLSGGSWRRGDCARRRRMDDYFLLWRDAARLGRFHRSFELDVADDGACVIEPADRRRAELTLGAVHQLDTAPDPRRARTEFLFRCESLLRSGVTILAHPFRVFVWSGMAVPEDLFAPLVALLKRYGAAAELNFHKYAPSPEFALLCARSGVKLSLGSDAHNLHEVAALHPHLHFLHELGLEPEAVLLRAPGYTAVQR